MVASAYHRIGHFCRQISPAFSDLKSAATNGLEDDWESLGRRIVLTVSLFCEAQYRPTAHQSPQAIGLQLLLIIV